MCQTKEGCVWCKDTAWWGRGGKRTCHSANESYNTHIQAGSAVSGFTKGRCEVAIHVRRQSERVGPLGPIPPGRCRCLIPTYRCEGREGERCKYVHTLATTPKTPTDRPVPTC